MKYTKKAKKSLSCEKKPTQKIESLTLLGQGSIPLSQKPSRDILEFFENRSANQYEVTLMTQEFTSLCPITGQPDYATITVQYTPCTKCLESKSFKFYLASFRQYGGFAESIINQILDDVTSIIDPKYIKVIGEFSSRGGISIRVVSDYPKQSVKL